MLISICAGPSRSNWDLIAKVSSDQIAPRPPGERQPDSKNEEASKINLIPQYHANNIHDIKHLLSVTFCTQMTRTPLWSSEGRYRPLHALFGPGPRAVQHHCELHRPRRDRDRED